jgi:hypothetical protein
MCDLMEKCNKMNICVCKPVKLPWIVHEVGGNVVVECDGMWDGHETHKPFKFALIEYDGHWYPFDTMEQVMKYIEARCWAHDFIKTYMEED